MARLDLDPKARKALAARLRDISKAEGQSTDDLTAIVRAALHAWDQPYSVTGSAHRIETVLRDAHADGADLARRHLRADLVALLPAPSKGANNPWPLLIASSAAYLASYVGREIARARMAGTAPNPAYAKGSIVRAIGGAIFGGYNTTTHDMARAAKSRGRVVVLRWDATLDRGTCPRCKALSGQVRPQWDEPPPLHGNCRCILHPVEMPKA